MSIDNHEIQLFNPQQSESLQSGRQLWDSKTQNQNNQNTVAYTWAMYKQLFPEARLYVFDLAGYGQAPLRVKQNDVYLIAGWSDKVFDVLQNLEEGETTLKKVFELVI
ncbi:hypothetical protein WBJ53_13695 [Spirosoma sp. SC4-14]|uniref:hypothetical protein n=1 Tax=Spirosoma sp. SC4-14 TaxID=3128900 RepID=UPI0030D52398